MKAVLLLVLLSISQLAFPQSDTIKISLAVKNKHEIPFDYNTLHERWIFIKNEDSYDVHFYIIDNYKKPHTTKFDYQKSYSIDSGAFQTALLVIDKTINLNDLKRNGIVDPPHPGFTCFNPPPKVIGRITVERSHSPLKRYFFDIENESAGIELETLRRILGNLEKKSTLNKE